MILSFVTAHRKAVEQDDEIEYLVPDPASNRRKEKLAEVERLRLVSAEHNVPVSGCMFRTLSFNLMHPSRKSGSWAVKVSIIAREHLGLWFVFSGSCIAGKSHSFSLMSWTPVFGPDENPTWIGPEPNAWTNHPATVG